MKYRLLILLLASALALPACTLKSSTEAQLERIPLNVEIKLPPGSSRARTATLTSADLPANVSQFTCFGINVTGPGIGPALQSAACTNGNGLGLGIFGGLIPLSGGEVQLLVPAGTLLTIQVFATITNDAACPNFATLLTAAQGALGAGPFYEVGRTERTMNRSEPVSITVAFDPAAPKKAFCTTKDTDPNSTGIWGHSTWGNAVWGE